MTAGDPISAVFDCTVFAQALINPKGPAAACLTHAQAGRLILHVSDFVLQEIRELPYKIKPQLGVTAERVERLVLDLAKYADPVENVPAHYTNPFDVDDSHYVNLAVITKSTLIITRDRHLLNLMDLTRGAGKDFHRRFPTLSITTPDQLAREMRDAAAK